MEVFSIASPLCFWHEQSMTNLLQVQNGSKAYGQKILFADASFAINESEHLGVIGPNGAGKTTLFKILTEQESLDHGEVKRSRSLRLGYLAQHDNWKADQSVENYLSSCVKPLWELKALANGLGLTEEVFSKPIASLSGGYRMRCKLLYLIGQDPNLMLLDEPTNYLDLETTLVLEKFLQNYKGAFLLISHDREFLRRTTDHILEIESGDITKYNGNIDDYFEQKAMIREQLESRAMSIQEKREKILDFVNRFGAKATKAKQAQSRLKSLSRLESIELKPLYVAAKIQIPPPVRAGKSIVTMTNASLGYGDAVILKDINYTLNNGDHVAVIGLNGAGKSTFLKSLAQVIKPLAGGIDLGYQVTIAYYAQHVAESLNPEQSVIEAMLTKTHPDLVMQDALNMAGSLLFSGNDIHKKVSVLSGGEKSRLALGQILLQRSPCLVLDEPTNHLDFQTVEALTQALNSYEGTVVVVSHDRSFIKRVGQKIVEINNGNAHPYPGTYDEYIWSLEKGILSERQERQERQEQDKKPTSVPSQEKTNLKANKKSLEQKIRQLEKQVLQLEKKLASEEIVLNTLNQKITQTEMSDDLNQTISEFMKKQEDFTSLENNWLQTSEELEAAKSELAALKLV